MTPHESNNPATPHESSESVTPHASSEPPHENGEPVAPHETPHESDEPVACPRCGRADGHHIGYHDDHELPFKRGQRVRVKAGAVLRTTLPDPSKRTLVNKRSRVITVASIHNGMSEHVGYSDKMENLWRHIDEPQVVWPGTGGYWHRANMSDCEVVPMHSCIVDKERRHATARR